MELVVLIGIGMIVAFTLFIGTVIYLYFFRLWFRSHIAQCSVSLGTIFAMFLRRGNPQLVINAYISAHKSGILLALDALEAHYKNKGDVKGVVQALIDAQTSGREVSFEELCQQDLQGKKLSA
jgi:uncharacterized protein YqfA (UPF0365 family)